MAYQHLVQEDGGVNQPVLEGCVIEFYHIHYKGMTNSSESNTPMVQDLPLHLPLFNVLKLEVPKELTPV